MTSDPRGRSSNGFGYRRFRHRAASAVVAAAGGDHDPIPVKERTAAVRAIHVQSAAEATADQPEDCDHKAGKHGECHSLWHVNSRDAYQPTERRFPQAHQKPWDPDHEWDEH